MYGRVGGWQPAHLWMPSVLFYRWNCSGAESTGFVLSNQSYWWNGSIVTAPHTRRHVFSSWISTPEYLHIVSPFTTTDDKRTKLFSSEIIIFLYLIISSRAESCCDKSSKIFSSHPWWWTRLARGFWQSCSCKASHCSLTVWQTWLFWFVACVTNIFQCSSNQTFGCNF